MENKMRVEGLINWILTILMLVAILFIGLKVFKPAEDNQQITNLESKIAGVEKKIEELDKKIEESKKESKNNDEKVDESKITLAAQKAFKTISADYKANTTKYQQGGKISIKALEIEFNKQPEISTTVKSGSWKFDSGNSGVKLTYTPKSIDDKPLVYKLSYSDTTDEFEIDLISSNDSSLQGGQQRVNNDDRDNPQSGGGTIQNNQGGQSSQGGQSGQNNQDGPRGGGATIVPTL